MKVNCQRITHVGCCIKRKPRENIKVCVNVSRTSYRQATDRLPTHHQQSADCRPTVGPLLYFGQNLSADKQLTDDQLSADRFFGELFFTITEPIEAAVQRNVVQISEKFFSALQCLLNTSFFVAHEEMALRRFASLCELQKKNGVLFGDQYKNDKGCKTFISHIAQVEKGKIQSTVSDSRFISIIIRWIY